MKKKIIKKKQTRSKVVYKATPIQLYVKCFTDLERLQLMKLTMQHVPADQLDEYQRSLLKRYLDSFTIIERRNLEKFLRALTGPERFKLGEKQRYVKDMRERFERLSGTHNLYRITAGYNLSSCDADWRETSAKCFKKIRDYILDTVAHPKNHSRDIWLPFHPMIYGWLDVPGKGRDRLKSTLVSSRSETLPHHHGIMAVRKDVSEKLTSLLDEDILTLPEHYWLSTATGRYNFVRSIHIDEIKPALFDQWIWYSTAYHLACGKQDGPETYGKHIEDMLSIKSINSSLLNRKGKTV